MRYGDGTSGRDYTFIEDIVDGVISAMERCSGYNIYNLGNSHPVLLKDLIALCFSVTGRKTIIEVLPDQPGDVRQTYADITRARNDLDYGPKTDIESGLRMMLDWLVPRTL